MRISKISVVNGMIQCHTELERNQLIVYEMQIVIMGGVTQLVIRFVQNGDVLNRCQTEQIHENQSAIKHTTKQSGV